MTTSRRRIPIKHPKWPRRTADGGIRLRIGIADVDALVPKGSAHPRPRRRELDLGLHRRVRCFPMLPDALSTDPGPRSSRAGERLVVVTELEIGEGRRGAAPRDLSRARRQPRQARLRIGRRWLEGPRPGAGQDRRRRRARGAAVAAGSRRRTAEAPCDAGRRRSTSNTVAAATPVAKDGVIESLRRAAEEPRAAIRSRTS